MRVLLLVFLVVKAETLRSERLPRRMAAEAVAVGPVLLLLAQAVLVAASVQKGRRPVLRDRTALVAAVVVPHQQA